MLTTSVSLSKDLSKDSLWKKTHPSQKIPKNYELETKDRAIFGLCSKQDIDEYFNELCQENRTSPIAVQKLANFTKYQPSSKPQAPKVLPTKTIGSDFAPSSMQSDLAPRVTMTKMSTATFDSDRVVAPPKKNVNFGSVWPQLDDEALELLKEFGISQTKLASMDSEEQKEKYIIKCMKRKLDAEYENWKKEVEKTEKEIQKRELQNEQLRLKFEKERTDVFSWLKLKNKFPFLKKKLKLGLMEVLNDVDNQKDIEKSLLLEEVRSKDKSIMSTTRRINLEHIPKVNNVEILADVLGHSEAIFKVNNAGRRKRNQIHLGLNDTTRSTSPRTFIFNTTQSSVQRDHNTTTESATELLPIQNALSKMNRTVDGAGINEGPSKYVWDYEAEIDFKDHKEEARARMFNEIKSSSWNEVGLGPFIRESYKAEKQKSQRNNLLKRFRKGEALTTREYSEIANTSMLLNSYSDTQFIQGVVNQLDPEIIEAVEIDLAQKILHDYQKSRIQLQKARMEYLQADNSMSKLRVKENDEVHERLMRIKYGKEEQQKMLKDILHRYETYQRRQHEKSIQEEQKSLQNVQSKDQIKNSEQKNLRQGTQAPLRKRNNLVIDAKASKRLHHPSSKLLIVNEERQKDFLGLAPNIVDPKLKNRGNEDPKEFMIHINSAPSLKRKDLFTHFYSGGPPEYEYESNSGYYATDIPKFKGTALEHKAATLLKSHIKGMVEREKFMVVKKHILDDRKVIRGLKNGEEGLPDIVRAMFLAITEDKTDSASKKRKGMQDSDVMQIITELQTKDPLLFRQFQREVMKQYQQYRMTHHNSREAPVSLGKFSRANDQKNSLILSLKNSMRVIGAQSQAGTLILDEAGGLAGSKTEIPSQPSLTNFNRKSVMTPTMLVHTVMNIDKTPAQKGKPKTIMRPKTSTNRESRTFGDFMNKTSALNQTVRSTRTKIIRPAESLSKLNQSEMLSGRSVLKSKDEIKELAEEEIKKRAEKIARREPPKGLLLKQRKLLTAAKTNNMQALTVSGYTFFVTDVNCRDDKKNTPLYYTAKFGNLEFCRYLTDIGARVNEPCEKGNTPLHMAFQSDNDAVVMLFLIKGGNLNILNDEGFTPLAFGTERLLTLLDLKDGVASYDMQGQRMRELPPEYDNNYLVNRGNWKSPPEDNTATFKYRPLDSPRDVIRKNDEYTLSQYVQPNNFNERLTRPVTASVETTNPEQPQQYYIGDSNNR